MSGRTLLIGLDGATYDVLDPLMDAGKMPNLKATLERGARGPLRTVMPPLTPNLRESDAETPVDRSSAWSFALTERSTPLVPMLAVLLRSLDSTAPVVDV